MNGEEIKKLLNEWMAFSEQVAANCPVGEDRLYALRVKTTVCILTIDELSTHD